jgi:hypothetical protein
MWGGTQTWMHYYAVKHYENLGKIYRLWSDLYQEKKFYFGMNETGRNFCTVIYMGFTVMPLNESVSSVLTGIEM